MSRIDSEGVFVGTIEESGVDVTKKGYPQWVARLKAVKKFIDTPADMQHFEIEEPAYVDWSSFNEDTAAFLVLFNSADEFNDASKLKNYEQLQAATGWDGASFDSLADGTMLGKEIQFRVEMSPAWTNPDTGKIREAALQVSWIDSKDAPAQRQLRAMDIDKVKLLSTKLTIGTKKAAAPAKPATKPGKPATAAPVTTTTAPQVVPSATVAATTAAAPAAVTPKPPKQKKAATPPPPVVEKTGLASETSQGDAWEYIITHKGDNEDPVVEEAWIAACGEVFGERDTDTGTGADWAKVRDITLKDLAV